MTLSASTHAYATFIGRVFVLTRSLANSGATLDQLHDLADAMHNVHLRFTDEVRWNEAFFVDAFLARYDEKWSEGGTSLRAMFEDCTARAS